MALSACSEKETPENQLRQFIAAGKTAAESRDVLSIKNFVSKNYMDGLGRNRHALVGLATGYFMRHKNIYLFTRIGEIKFPVAEQANVKLFVAMAGTPVTGINVLQNIQADLYQFDLIVAREGDVWRLQESRWQRAHIEDFISGG